jgi:hypothetical protein
LNTAIILAKGDQILEADASTIDDYVLHLRELYDFDKQKTAFVYITDTEVYHEFEEELFTIFPSLPYGFKSRPIITKKPKIEFWGKIIGRIEDWIRIEKGRKYGIKNISEIFFLACMIEEKAGSVTRKTINKETVTLDEIKKISEHAKDNDSCIIFSPFLFSTKLGVTNKIEDMLVGLSIYDIKNRCTLAFNIQSLVSFNKEHGVSKKDGLYDMVKYLFAQTVSGDLEVRSYLPAPIDSPYYTVLPWVCYSILLPITLDKQNGEAQHRLTIPEFFVYGYSSLPDEENSFIFSNFSIHKEGRAVCILNFNKLKERLKYTLRFDQSVGERLVHLDFSLYDGNEIKLIAHRPLDFEEVYRFNVRLFIGMMLAGIFDSYFSTLVKDGIKGLRNLAEKNAAFLYPYYWIWMIETFVRKLNEDEHNYLILDKLFKGAKLDKREEDFINSMKIGAFNVASTDPNGKITGLSALGYVVLIRHIRGQSSITALTNS